METIELQVKPEVAEAFRALPAERREHALKLWEGLVLTQCEETGHHTVNGSAWENSLEIIESFRGKLPVLPREALTAEGIYRDHD